MIVTLSTFALLLLGLAIGARWYERSQPSSRMLVLIATLAALAVLGRIAFAPLPNVKPTTDIIFFAGFALGATPGFAVGLTAPLVSNFYFGQGPWTPWQMLAWGLVGLIGAAVGARSRRLSTNNIDGDGGNSSAAPSRLVSTLLLASICALCGLFFGVIMNVQSWLTTQPDHSLNGLLIVFATSLPFDLAHAGGNFFFALIFGPTMVLALARFRRRLNPQWVALLALTVIVGSSLAATPSAHAAGRDAASRDAIKYLRKAQNKDGGLGTAPGEKSDPIISSWAAVGFAASKVPPRKVRVKGGKSLAAYVRKATSKKGLYKGDWSIGAVERSMVALRASGYNARKSGGINLLSRLTAAQTESGSFGGFSNWTAWGLIALKAAKVPATDERATKAASWLKQQQNDDGGFSYKPKGDASSVDDSASAIQGLIAAGERASDSVKKAVEYIEDAQNVDGGFGFTKGGKSNAQSTAWAIQALVAAKVKMNDVRMDASRTPIEYLRSLQTSDGKVHYSRTENRGRPVWVTAQTLTGLAQKPFPVAP